MTMEASVMMAESGGMAQDPSAREARAELSRQDVELLVLLADGLPLDAVARRVNASERTVRRRVRAICDRLGLSSTIQVVAWAARQGLV
jgi:DNA-binding NarL/FixJ family response regulator